MITGFSIDFDKLPTQALKNLIANDVLLGERSQLTVDDIIRICEILVTREKPRRQITLNKLPPGKV